MHALPLSPRGSAVVSDPVQLVRGALEVAGCRPHGRSYDFRARCPAHDGENRESLHASVGADGRAVLYCFARQCPAEDICGALGLTVADLFPPGHRYARRLPLRPVKRADFSGSPRLCGQQSVRARGTRHALAADGHEHVPLVREPGRPGCAPTRPATSWGTVSRPRAAATPTARRVATPTPTCRRFSGSWRRERKPMAPDPFAKLAPAAACEMLDRLAAFNRRYVVVTATQRDVVALWAAHTHVRGVVPGDDSKLELAFRRSPLLSVTSAQKESGKTRQLEVLDQVVADPWFTERVSAAALVRKIARDSPTLLLDESDAAFKGNQEYAEALRGIINAGYRRGGAAHLCVPPRFEVQAFPVFCAKAIAGIGKLPDTAASRSIPIRLQHRAPGEWVENFYEDEVAAEAGELRDWLRDFGAANADRLAAARPDVPAGLRDRTAEISMPLLAIADLVGGSWPERARAALIELLTGADAEDDNIGSRLLADVPMFDWRREQKIQSADRIRTADLINALCQIEESPWGETAPRETDHRPRDLDATPAIRNQDDAGQSCGRDRPRLQARAIRGCLEPVSAPRHPRRYRDDGVTPRSAPQAEGNAGNAGNAWGREKAGIPIPGEEPPAAEWECSCGASAGGRTVVSLREPHCPLLRQGATVSQFEELSDTPGAVVYERCESLLGYGRAGRR